MADANVRILVAQGSICSGLDVARVALFASLRNAHLTVFLPELGHANLIALARLGLGQAFVIVLAVDAFETVER